MIRLLVPALAALLLVAGCGGAATAEPATATGVIPAEAAAVVAVDLDRLADVPALREAVADALAEEGFELAALGGEAVAVALEEGEAVVLVRGGDLPPDVAARELDGWTALAESERTLDRYEAALGRGTLEGSAAYEAAEEEWPDDALATAFADGAAVAQALRSALGSLAPVGMRAEWVSAAATVDGDTVRVRGVARGGGQEEALPVPAGLLERVPDGAAALAAFGPGQLSAEMRGALPVPLLPLLDLAEGGGVLWLGPGALEVTALVAADDPAAALDAAAESLGGEREGDRYRLRVGGLTVVAAARDGAVVASTSEAALDREAGGRPEELDAVPEDATAVLVADAGRVLPLLSLLGKAPRGATPPVRSVTAWSAPDGDDARFELVAELRGS